MKAVSTFDELTAKLQEAEEAQAISDDAFRNALTSWYFSPALIANCPDDPYSPEYRAFQLDFYERLANDIYSVAKEQVNFNFEHELQWPYPYGTKSAATVGTHLMGYGWLIRKIDLPPGSRILEIGSGYGALTFHLASMGYRVTCLDINADLLKFVEARTAGVPQPIETICGDMAAVEIPGTYDAVIFNASLHHSLEHRAVIQRLDSILVSNGLVAFTSEPIVDNDSVLVPYPWGIRMGGFSMWTIRTKGCMELGFHESYFVRMLKDLGYHVTRYNLGLSGHTDLWLASQGELPGPAAGAVATALGHDVDLETEVIRLRNLVEGYENGRFMRFMHWFNTRFRH
jgi:2-polyprenyl-3-methyl-5-hydroxy-6-metoxy-1,4-benzoquinol methylase